jgi:hypothetical protein
MTFYDLVQYAPVITVLVLIGVIGLSDPDMLD